MNKTLIRANLTAFIPDIEATTAQGLHFVFGETNSYFNHGVANVNDSGDAALWIVDYVLFAATLGIERLYFH